MSRSKPASSLYVWRSRVRVVKCGVSDVPVSGSDSCSAIPSGCPQSQPAYFLDVALVFPLAVAFFSVDSIHGWHVSSWNVRQAAFSGLLVCVFLLLIKDIIRVIAEILSFLTFVLGWRFAFHSDLTAFGYALVCVLGIPLIIILGVLFRIYVLKSPVTIPPTTVLTGAQRPLEYSWF